MLAADRALRVLADHHVLDVQRLHGSEHLDLLVADVLGAQCDGLLHRDEGEDLQQVVLDDVADDPVLVEVPSPPVRPKVLLEDDLDRLDILAAPQRLEHQVGEAQHDQVLHQLLRQVVVDPVNLVLGEVAAERLRKEAGRLGVASEGLLDDGARPARLGHRRGLDAGRRGDERRGREGEVEDAVGVVFLPPRHLRVEFPEGLNVVVRTVDVATAGQEV
mmetsp:Transcript_5526/g.9576  ORF Transcript_5526/g.9576 Transcript_5526/m.9576 type:complete len:218 (+) Transcript_5526:1206-1859(+)